MVLKNSPIIRLISIVFAFLLFHLSVYSQCPQLVWSDEFSGNVLDEAKWNYQIGDGCAEGICGWGNNELQSYQEANVTVENGLLKITARKQRIRNKAYTSGRINTKGKADFTYGRFEASIKLPAGDGLWPAFWMLSTNEPYGGWPQSGEIDIMEFVASNPDEIFGTIHYGDPYPNNQFQGNTAKLSEGTFPEAFHEFAIEWEPGEIRWFLDGILYSTKTTADVSPYQWPFDQDFHFLLNVAVGGNLGGPVNDSMLPATMEVDYVRVYDGFKPYVSGNKIVENQASGEAYILDNISNGTTVTWSVPSDATIVSGQGSSQIIVDFGNESGLVSASFDSGCGNETLHYPVTVDPTFSKTYSFENFDDPPSASYASSTGTLTEVNNPAPDGINSSILSGQYTRNGSEQYDVLVYDLGSLVNGDDYVNRNKKIYMDVYTAAPIGTEILLQLETPDASGEYPAGRHSRFVATITQQNTWERLEFTLLDEPDGNALGSEVNTMVLLFASNSFTSDTYFFDNLDNYDADNGTGQNIPPTVSISNPSNGSSFTQGTNILVAASASDADGTVTQVEFFADGSTIGIDTTAPYEVNWTVPLGTTDLTAVATDNENAQTTSDIVTVTGQAEGNATTMSVSTIVTGTANAGRGAKYGTALVSVQDDLGNPVENATVTGTFSGTFTEQVSALTDANGEALLQTNGTAKGNVTVDLCVDDISHASLTYDPLSNTITCTSGSSSGKSGPEIQSIIKEDDLPIQVYPNPMSARISIQTPEDMRSGQAELLDLNGRVLQSSLLRSNLNTIDISGLPQGLYLLKIVGDNGQQTVYKLIK